MMGQCPYLKVKDGKCILKKGGKVQNIMRG